MTKPEPSGRRTALVVDDEPDLVRLVTAYLQREQFDVITAGDGERAVAVAREAEPDVIVLDLMLPVLDGVEACRRIRMFSDAYVIMLTAKSDEVDKLVGLSPATSSVCWPERSTTWPLTSRRWSSAAGRCWPTSRMSCVRRLRRSRATRRASPTV